MTPEVNEFAVFVKPWKEMTLGALGAHIHALGFRWIELPVRPEFPCQPETIETRSTESSLCSWRSRRPYSQRYGLPANA